MKITEFVLQNINSITLIIAIFTGFFAFVKWVDSRNREIRREERKEYIKLISAITGGINISEQVASVWMLLEYKKYYRTTLKVLDNDLWGQSKAPDIWKKYVLPAIKDCIEEIKSSN